MIDRTLTGTTPLGQSGPGTKVNEEVLHSPEIPRTGASLSNVVYCHPQNLPPFWALTPLQGI